jgi:hypothetical protein
VNKLKLAVATAALAVGVAMSSHADAQCWWNGYGWSCSSQPGYGYGSAPYNAQFNDPARYGYLPRGLPHPNGPMAGGGGCYMGQAPSGCGDQ